MWIAALLLSKVLGLRAQVRLGSKEVWHMHGNRCAAAQNGFVTQKWARNTKDYVKEQNRKCLQQNISLAETEIKLELMLKTRPILKIYAQIPIFPIKCCVM